MTFSSCSAQVTISQEVAKWLKKPAQGENTTLQAMQQTTQLTTLNHVLNKITFSWYIYWSK